jgi:hypothetical protein
MLKGHEAAIRAEVELQSDATLEELAERVAKREGMKVRVSAPTMCRELQRIGLPGKRSRSTSGERDPPRVKRARNSYRRRLFEWVMEHLLFIDEISVNLALTRLYG